MEGNTTALLNTSLSVFGAVAMKTLLTTGTLWVTETSIVKGTAQWPVVTLYTSLQDLALASYPDPIMTATGADLQSLLAHRHSVTKSTSDRAMTSVVTTTVLSESPSATMQSDTVPEGPTATTDSAATNTSREMSTTMTEDISEHGTLISAQSSTGTIQDVNTTPLMESTVYSTFTLTTTLCTFYPDHGYGTQDSEDYGSIGMSDTSKDIQTSEVSVTSKETALDAVCSETSAEDFVVTVTATVPALATTMETYIRGRQEIPESNARMVDGDTQAHNVLQQSGSNLWPKSSDGLEIVLWMVGFTFATLLILQLVWILYNRKSHDNLAYTSKPPRPGLRKRLSISVTGRKLSNPSEATHVSGHAESIGRASGKGHREGEARRTPITPRFEV